MGLEEQGRSKTESAGDVVSSRTGLHRGAVLLIFLYCYCARHSVSHLLFIVASVMALSALICCQRSKVSFKKLNLVF